MAKKAETPEIRFGRLCLVTPHDLDADRFAPELDVALRSGLVATLILDLGGLDGDAALLAAERLVPLAQANDVATIVADDVELALRVQADGVQVGTGHADLRRALGRLHPDRIVGAAGLRTRHEAMVAGENECDYLFFGRLDGDTGAHIFDKALDLAAWWSAVFEIPAVVMGGNTVASVAEAVDAGIEFVALRDAVWQHEAGVAAALSEANALALARQGLTVP